jgi:hypothetical protein
MLLRAFSSWGKLFGRGESSLTAQEERRVWGRIRCDVETTCSLARAAAERLPARVRNVSRGGINLEMSRSFQPGELVSIAVPASGDAETSEVLACVIRCEAPGLRVGLVSDAEDSRHQLACNFATQLSDADLMRFGGLKAPPATNDQRASVRFPCPAQAVFTLVSTPEEEEVPSSAVVLNVSASGIALRVPGPRTVGELLNIELRCGEDQPVVTTLASIVRTTVERDGQRLVGCSFINELSEEQVRRLL